MRNTSLMLIGLLLGLFLTFAGCDSSEDDDSSSADSPEDESSGEELIQDGDLDELLDLCEEVMEHDSIDSNHRVLQAEEYDRFDDVTMSMVHINDPDPNENYGAGYTREGEDGPADDVVIIMWSFVSDSTEHMVNNDIIIINDNDDRMELPSDYDFDRRDDRRVNETILATGDTMEMTSLFLAAEESVEWRVGMTEGAFEEDDIAVFRELYCQAITELNL